MEAPLTLTFLYAIISWIFPPESLSGPQIVELPKPVHPSLSILVTIFMMHQSAKSPIKPPFPSAANPSNYQWCHWFCLSNLTHVHSSLIAVTQPFTVSHSDYCRQLCADPCLWYPSISSISPIPMLPLSRLTSPYLIPPSSTWSTLIHTP